MQTRTAGLNSAAVPDDELSDRFQPVFDRIAAGAVDRERDRILPFEPIAWLREAGFGTVRVPREAARRCSTRSCCCRHCPVSPARRCGTQWSSCGAARARSASSAPRCRATTRPALAERADHLEPQPAIQRERLLGDVELNGVEPESWWVTERRAREAKA